MKKNSLILGLVLSVLMTAGISTVNADNDFVHKHHKKGCPCKCKCHKPQFDKKDIEQMKKKQEERKKEFEARLNLTEQQKEIAKQNRIKAHEEMKPLMEEIKNKKEQIGAIKKTKLTDEEKAKRIAPLKKDLKALKIKAEEKRKANMAAFEAILTDTQKAELQKMKEERKAKFEQMKNKKPCFKHHMQPVDKD